MFYWVSVNNNIDRNGSFFNVAGYLIGACSEWIRDTRDDSLVILNENVSMDFFNKIPTRPLHECVR